MTERISNPSPQSHYDPNRQQCSLEPAPTAAPGATESTARTHAAPSSEPNHTPADPPETDPAVDALIRSYQPQSRAAAAARAQSPEYFPALPTNDNAQRTAAVPTQLGYFDVGSTSSEDSTFAGVALLKGSDRGMNAEVLSASVQLGAQSEAQAALIRLGGCSSNGACLDLRILEAQGHVGEHNPDGSTGENVGASASVLAGELSLNRAGNSFTIGGSWGSGGGISVGTRDVDADGQPELCARVAVGPVVVGGCIESAAAK